MSGRDPGVTHEASKLTDAAFRSRTWLVARREIAERLQGSLIKVMTLILTLAVVAVIVIPALLRGNSKPTVVGLVGPQAQALSSSLQTAAMKANVTIHTVAVDSEAVARSQVDSGALDAALMVSSNAATAMVKEALDPAAESLLQATVNQAHAVQALRAMGLPIDRILPALRPTPFSTTVLQPRPSDLAARAVAAIAATLLLYVTVGIYGNAVASGVAQEKTSRIAEVLLGAVRPLQLMIGKVVGIGACGLLQIAIPIAAGLIANAFVQNTIIPSTIWVLLPMTLLFFLLGYTLYSFAYAAAGALVARQEEVQFVSWPLGMPLLGGYLLTYAAVASPDAVWVRALSFVPPLTPMLMPARFALGHVDAWEPVVAVVLMLVTVYGIARVAARIYTGALVRSGARLSWRAALRLQPEQ
jgi:ABC-2 type transport system permease protein